MGALSASIPVCIFAKPPVPGRVKTRLAAAIGHESAAQLASAMLHDVWSVVASTAAAIPVLAAAEPGDFNLEVAPENVWLQPGSGLGSRIEAILRRGLEQAPSAIALGADSPLLTPDILMQGIKQLESGNAVLGPCDDGGFYFLGLNSCPPGLLDGIPWSCALTYNATECQLRSKGMKVTQIGASFDIDTLADLHHLRRELCRLGPEVAPRTRTWLNETAWSVS